MPFLFTNDFVFEIKIVTNSVIAKKHWKKNWGISPIFLDPVTEISISTGQFSLMIG